MGALGCDVRAFPGRGDYGVLGGGPGNPIHAARGVDIVASSDNPGGNMEGKEVRFGIANSALYATVTTDASCGAVNAMHDSFTPSAGWCRW